MSDHNLLFYAKNHQAIIDEKNQQQIKDLSEKINEIMPKKKQTVKNFFLNYKFFFTLNNFV